MSIEAGAESRKPARKAPARLVSVAVFAAIPQALTYSLPAAGEVVPGQRVEVPLGARRAIGIVLGRASRPAPGIEVRELLRVLDSEPVLPSSLLELGQWIADYYLAPLGEVFRSMLPLLPPGRRARVVVLTAKGCNRRLELSASLLGEERLSEEAALLEYVATHPEVSFETLRQKFRRDTSGPMAKAIEQGWISIREVERSRGRRETLGVRLAGPVPSRPGRLSPVAQRVLNALASQSEANDHRQLLKATGGSLEDLRKLSRQGLIEIFTPPAALRASPAALNSVPDLSEAQSRTLEELAARLDERSFGVTLVHGVTASGKTEIYLRLIARCLEQRRSALMLVPEIALTPAIESFFVARFGAAVAVLHSSIGPAERQDAWWRVRRGEARVVLGTRSAVFAPIGELGVLIVDEEHEATYKQEETPRYNGRDVAIVRARLERALVVLGSATPSLESYANAREGKYRLLTIPERIGGRSLARVEIVDMREEFRRTHSQVPISGRLHREIELQMKSGGQTMILLNRRGYSWFLLCRSCGQTERCVNCSISLTFHRRENRLLCHYCGYAKPVPARCTSCGSEYLHYVGEGTEKLEVKLAEMFPGARVARLDRDAARRPAYFQKTLGDFREGKIQILVGTQLIAKGHDFPGVTLVGVVSADTMLALPDFRAAERTFQLLTQAAGRAGRGDAPGRVLVQTFYPEHYAIRLAAEQNYEGFFSKEIRFRRMMHYPPAAALANVIIQDPKLDRAAKIAAEIGRLFSEAEATERVLKVLGPSPAAIARVKGVYRIQFLLKSSSRARLHAVLRRVAEECHSRGIPPRSVMMDVDPLSLM
jgi:primosomal protein N' (replication factor Y)